jgi:hypothetical protein
VNTVSVLPRSEIFWNFPTKTKLRLFRSRRYCSNLSSLILLSTSPIFLATQFRCSHGSNFGAYLVAPTVKFSGRSSYFCSREYQQRTNKTPPQLSARRGSAVQIVP